MSVLFTKTNTLVDIFTPQYLEYCQNSISRDEIANIIKGKYPNIKYTTSGYDLTDLSADEKLELVQNLFNMHSNKSGYEVASNKLESIVLTARDRLGADKSFTEILSKLPKGVFDDEKFQNMSKEELISQLKLQMAEVSRLSTKQANPNTDNVSAKNDVLETILYNTGDGVFSVDSSGKIITFNRTMEDLTGYTSEEALGRSADDVVKLHDDTSPIDVERYNPGIKNGEGQKIYSNSNVVLEGRDSVKKNVKIMSSTLPATQEGSVGCIVTLSDMSKESQLETMKLDFVSIAAHELRTPITSIRGYLELLSASASDVLSTDDLDYLRKITISSDQLYILVENLLNISRIERGNLILQKNTENWQLLVESVISNFKSVAEDAGVTISMLKPNGPLPLVAVDKVMISEVLSNLIDNAVKYNKRDGRVTVVLEINPTEVITHIKDSGVGIPDESTPHLFKKFYRTSTSVWRQGKKGTGLGLFISHEIVKLHGGRIWFESKVGEGSTFSFSVPAVSSA